MSKITEIKKAQTTLGMAKKAAIGVLGDIASLSFMPIEAALNQLAERAESNKAFEDMEPEAVEALKAETAEKQLCQLIEDANHELAKIMEARNPKKPTPKPEQVAEPIGEQD